MRISFIVCCGAIALATACTDSEQSYRQGIRVLCTADQRAGAGAASPAERQAKIARWIDENLHNHAARKLAFRLAEEAPGSRTLILVQAARTAGLDQCLGEPVPRLAGLAERDFLDLPTIPDAHLQDVNAVNPLVVIRKDSLMLNGEVIIPLVNGKPDRPMVPGAPIPQLTDALAQLPDSPDTSPRRETPADAGWTKAVRAQHTGQSPENGETLRLQEEARRMAATLTESPASPDQLRSSGMDLAEKVCADEEQLLASRLAEYNGVPDDWNAWWDAGTEPQDIVTKLLGTVSIPDAATGPRWALIVSCDYVKPDKTWKMRVAAIVLSVSEEGLSLSSSFILGSQGCCGHTVFVPDVMEAVDINGDGHSELHVRGEYELMGGQDSYFHGEMSQYHFVDTAQREASYKPLFEISLDCEEAIPANLTYLDDGFKILRSGHVHDMFHQFSHTGFFTKVQTRVTQGKQLRAPHGGHEIVIRSTYYDASDKRQAAPYGDAYYSGGMKGEIHDRVTKFKKSATSRFILRWNGEGRWLEIECKGKRSRRKPVKDRE